MFNGKLFYKTAAFILLLMIPGVLFSQSSAKPKISIFPLENKEKELPIEVVSQNIQKTVEFNLKIINEHNVIQNSLTDYTDYSSDTLWLLYYCEKHSIDDLIFGKAFIQPDGSVFVEMSVFNREKAAITLTKSETANTVFDMPKAADIVAIKIMESLCGAHLGFGGMKFINRGEQGKYSVYVDNVFAGENIADLPKIVNGSRNVVIIQKRMFGDIKIYDKTIGIAEDKTVEIGFSVPGFLEKEGDSVSREELYIEKNWDNLYAEKNIDKSFNTLFKLLTITDYSQTAYEKKKQIEEKFAQWNAKKEELSFFSLFDNPMGASFFGGINLNLSRYTEVGSSDWSSTNNFNPKLGISIFLNMPPYFGFQSELIISTLSIHYKNETTGEKKGADFELVELPFLLLFKFPPDKVFSVYAGGVLQFRVGYTKYGYIDAGGGSYPKDKDIPLKRLGPAFAAGILFEIPLNTSRYMSFDFRYVRSLQNWTDESFAELYPDYFHMTVGLGLKFKYEKN